MIFTRTMSGIANFAKFIGSDILVYTEGKSISVNSEQVFDALFYKALIGHLYPNKQLKIKCVGSKTVALEYALKLSSLGKTGSVVIVDRDGEDFICALNVMKNIIYTDGYSWENDFWTPLIASAVINELACNNQKSIGFNAQFNSLCKPLAFVSVLDICSHINMEALLPKNGGGCGIGLDFTSQNVFPKSEFRRLIKKFKNLDAKNCPVCKSILRESIKANHERAIQGHLWEHVILNLISFAISGSRKAKVPHYLVKNLAMSKFQTNPAAYMNPSTINYYRNEFKLRF